MGLLKTNDHIHVKIKMPDPILESPKSGFKGHWCSCTFKTRIDPKLGTWVYQRPITIFISRSRYQTPVKNIQHPALRALNQDFKDMNVLCTFKITMESQNSEHGCIKDQKPYECQDQDAKPQSGTSSILQSPNEDLKKHWCSLHLQNQDRESKFWRWVYRRPVTISNQNQNAQSQSVTSSILQSPISGHKWHGGSLHL